MANNLCFHLCFFLVFMFLCQTPIEAYNAGFSVQLIRQNSRNSPLHKSDELHKHRFHSFYQVPKKSSSPNGPTTRMTSNNDDYLMKLIWEHHLWTYMVWLTQAVTLCGHNVHLAMVVISRKVQSLRSKTYSAMPCDSEQCNSLFGHSCSPQKLCAHSYVYGDGSVTNGVLARETVTFSSTNGDPVVVGDIIFGCGYSNSGIFNENDVGIIGLGGGPLSLVSQIGTLYGGKRFSHCLVPFHTDPRTSGTISFGDVSDVSGDGVVTTPLVSEDGQTPYLVTWEGISVGDTFLPFNSSEMLLKGNIMIDSGTPATYFPQEFYDRLVEELKVQSSLIPIEDDPDLGTQLCYRSETNLEGQF